MNLLLYLPPTVCEVSVYLTPAICEVSEYLTPTLGVVSNYLPPTVGEVCDCVSLAGRLAVLPAGHVSLTPPWHTGTA